MQKKYYWLAALWVVAAMVLTACPAPAPAAVPAEPAAAEAAPTEAPTEAPAEAAAAAPATGDCAPATEGELAGIDPTGQTVVWWHQHSGAREENLKLLVEEFNTSNPCGIKVDAQNQGGYDDIRDKVNAGISAGEVPAALIVGYQNDQAFYQLNDGLVDLNTYLNDATWGYSADEQADFYGSFFNQSVHPNFNNQRLGFPPNRSMEVLYYNQTWMEALGFTAAPKTPDEFKAIACAAAKENGDGTGGYILRDDGSSMASWTYAYGGDILAADGKGYAFNGEATVQAMTMLKGLFEEKCAYFLSDPKAFPNADFAARRAIFAQGSSSGIPFYGGDVKTAAEEAKRDADAWGVAAIPHTTAEPRQNVYGGDVMIPVTTPEQQLAAWIFTKWYTSPEIMAKWDVISGYFPTRQAALPFLADYLKENTQWAQAVELLPFSYYEPQLISYTAVRDEMKKAFNAIMQGADAQTTLNELTIFANDKEAEMMAEVK